VQVAIALIEAIVSQPDPNAAWDDAMARAMWLVVGQTLHEMSRIIPQNRRVRVVVVINLSVGVATITGNLSPHSHAVGG